MPFDKFKDIISSHIIKYGVPKVVNLQGEGEPTLNSSFFAMADYVLSRGSIPYVITNGTSKYPEKFSKVFKSIGVSVDSINSVEAESIGRPNLNATLNFISAVKPTEVIVHSVRGAVPLESTHNVISWCRANSLKHIVQNLQGKEDYANRYPDKVVFVKTPVHFSCGFLDRDIMRYYNVDGKELPCCFIKDVSSYSDIKTLRLELYNKKTPIVCRGCSNLV